jgi:hypothetical protein
MGGHDRIAARPKMISRSDSICSPQQAAFILAEKAEISTALLRAYRIA